LLIDLPEKWAPLLFAKKEIWALETSLSSKKWKYEARLKVGKQSGRRRSNESASHRGGYAITHTLGRSVTRLSQPFTISRPADCLGKIQGFDLRPLARRAF
jgi:hypothetical protein